MRCELVLKKNRAQAMLPTSRLAIRESVTTMAEKSVLTEMAMA